VLCQQWSQCDGDRVGPLYRWRLAKDPAHGELDGGLLADRLGNREIANRMHLSSRTVEKYVSNLISKTGLPNRFALSEYAVTCQS